MSSPRLHSAHAPNTRGPIPIGLVDFGTKPEGKVATQIITTNRELEAPLYAEPCNLQSGQVRYPSVRNSENLSSAVSNAKGEKKKEKEKERKKIRVWEAVDRQDAVAWGGCCISVPGCGD